MEVEKYLLKYESKKDEKEFRVLGKEFVITNKNRGKIIYNNKKISLRNSISIKKNKKLKIHLLLNKNVCNKAFMFKNCTLLSEIIYYKDIYYDNYKQLFEENNPYIIFKKDEECAINCNERKIDLITNVEDFYNESNYSPFITYQSTISENRENQNSQNNLISEINYEELINHNTPGIITSIIGMFYNCKSLKNIHDISGYNTEYVLDMSEIFYYCSSLTSLPDISKWKTNNVTDMNKIFYKCRKLYSLPDISKWITENVFNMNSLFYECSSLKELPDISKWNTKNVFNMNSMFYDCSNLKNFPDISRWKTDNVETFNFMFKSCNKLFVLPDI